MGTATILLQVRMLHGIRATHLGRARGYGITRESMWETRMIIVLLKKQKAIAQRHPLEVRVVVQQARFSQPKYSWLGPTPCRVALISPSGGGKTSAVATWFNQIAPLCDRWHIFSSTVDHDRTYKPMKDYITKAQDDRQIDTDDAEENPFHDSLKDFDMVLSHAKKRSTEAEQEGSNVAPQTLILIDDLLTGYRNNHVLEIAFIRSRHWGCNIAILSQVLRGLSSTVRKNNPRCLVEAT